MAIDSGACERGRTRPRLHRDRGTTFIEILVAVIILGIGGVATLTALSVSIRGSDTHRFRINAVSELEGAGAYLARTEFNSTCTPLPTQPALETALGDRPGANNSEITLLVTGVTCSGGLPLAELEASSDRGNATESLEVVLGGISVLKPEGAGSPGPGCTWGTLTASPPSVNVHTSGANAGKLRSGAKINLSLTFSGSCTGPITATITSSATPTFTKVLNQDPLDPQLLNATLETNEIYWRPATYTVSVPVAASTTFVVG